VRWAYDGDDVRSWVRSILIPASEVFVAERDGEIVAFMALSGDFVTQLYVRPVCWRGGIGSKLLGLAKAKEAAGLRLYCFQQNQRARAFYEGHGFEAVAFSDGADNEEGEPEMLYVWRGVGSP
jgi:GNAT superfamily N-acetyltransferase